nr:hypothetical protein Itr_chr05CG07470 [Ipomoea trifida]
MGSSSSSAFNFGFNFSNQQQPTPLIAYHHQQHYDVIGNNISALNTTNNGLNNNMVHPNQEPTLAYQQYVMGNISGFNSGVNYPNQQPQPSSSSLAYQHYDIGIWE